MSPPEVTPPPLLTVEGLALRRGERLLFEGLNLRAEAGQLMLVRGPNGAGKSSLLLTIAGVLRPSEGRITLSGSEDEAATAIHYVGHLTGVKTRLTLLENLRFWASLQGGGGARPDEALETVGLGGRGGLDAGYLSAGQTRRLALARLLISRRPVWLLDEPTTALDTEGHALVERLVGAHVAAGGAALVATHDDIEIAGPGRVTTLTLGAVA